MKKFYCQDFIMSLPKAELHIHLEGTLSPEQYLFFAQRNNIHVPYSNVDEVKKDLYSFSDLSSFIAAYKKVSQVLCTEADFYDLTFAYLKKAHSQGVLHTEIFFDFQCSSYRGIAPSALINGMHQAYVDALAQFNITASSILSILRDSSEEDAFKAYDLLRIYKDNIVGIGLASIEKGNPPSKFERVFARAREDGYHLTAHAGEEVGSDYIRQAITQLHVERIDHGISCMRDPLLVHTLAATQLPLTVCPLSNVALGNVSSLETHPIRAMFDAGLMVTINSDDPAFFDGYIADNYIALGQSSIFSCAELVTCARNSFLASFCSIEAKKRYLAQLDEYCYQHECLGS